MTHGTAGANADPARVHECDGLPYGAPVAGYPTILHALRDRATGMPDAPYLTVITADDDRDTLSYGQLDERSAAVAARLLGLGVRPGDVLAVVPANDVRSVVKLYGVLRAGASALILSPNDPPARLDEQARALAVRLALRHPDAPGPTALTVLAMDDLPDGGAPPVDRSGPDPDSRADAVLLGTSGSTAASKVVVQSHHNIMANAEAVHRHHELRAGQRLLSLLPIYHANALNLAVFGALYAGAHAVLPDRFDPLRAGRIIETTEPTIVSVAPTILEALLHTWRDPAVPAELTHVLSAAAPLTARTALAVRQSWGVPVLQGYGLTETTDFATTMPGDLSVARRGQVRLVPLTAVDGQTTSLDPLIEALTPQTPLVLLQTAANPTGALVCEGDLERLISAAHPNTIVILDECHEWLGADVRRTPMRAAANVVRVSSLSKHWSAPGMKVGWMLADADFIDRYYEYASTTFGGPASFFFTAVEMLARMERWRVQAVTDLDKSYAAEFEATYGLDVGRLQMAYNSYVRERQTREEDLRVIRDRTTAGFAMPGIRVLPANYSINLRWIS